MISVKPPQQIPEHGFRIFLAGTIEMGNSIDWQSRIENSLKNTPAVILNPRRNFWDAGWKTSADDKHFAQQVNWELDGLNLCDLIIMYFDPTSKSPISLLELGLFATTGKMIVCCPEGYWKKGNVDIVCRRNGIRQVDDMEQLIMTVLHIVDPEIEIEA